MKIPRLSGLYATMIIILGFGSSSLLYAAGSDGLFGDYFTRMVGTCAISEVVTGFDSATDTYGTRQCTGLKAMIAALGDIEINGNLTVSGGILKTPAINLNQGDVSAMPCNSTTEGVIRYNKTTKKFEGCNGTSWSELTMGTGSTTTPVSNPKVTLMKDQGLTTPTSSYALGEYLYGYIDGGDPMNTWACTDIPGGNTCANRANWRQLTKNYDGHVDDWLYNTTSNRIEATSGFYIHPTYFPTGLYTMHVANGRNGTDTVTNITVLPVPAPKVVFTDNTLATTKTNYIYGENLYGYINGGDPTNTWACTEFVSWGGCANRANWRQLTKPYSQTGYPDDWQYNSSTKRIELKNGFSTNGYPTGAYRSYTANGQNGTATVIDLTLSPVPVQCKWVGGFVIGPVGATNPDSNNPSTCNTTTNGTSAREISTGRVIATCTCQ